MTTTRGNGTYGTTRLNINLSTSLKRTMVRGRRLSRRQHIPTRLSVDTRSATRRQRFFMLRRNTSGTRGSNPRSANRTRARNRPDHFFVLQRVLHRRVPIRIYSPPFLLVLQVFISINHVVCPFSRGIGEFVNFLLRGFQSG